MRVTGTTLRKLFLSFPAAAIAGGYAAAGVLWILFSDYEAALIAPDEATLVRLQAIKGWLFVLVTGAMLYLLLCKYHQALAGREAALREKNRMLSTLLRNLPGMAYRCANDPDWTLEFISDGCVELTGYAPQDLVGNAAASYGGLIHPEDRETVWNDVQRALETREAFRLVYRITTRDGAVKWVWEQGRGVYSESGLEALEGFITDVTESKQLQEQLRHAQKLEAIGRVAGSVAHDFNNLLTAIRGYSQLLQHRLDRGGSPRGEAEEIARTVERASGLTQQLLAFSRKQKMQRQRIDLNRVVQDMQPLLEHLAGKRVRLRLEIPAAPVWVLGDRSQMEQVIMNLAVNAVDAMPEGGDLRLELETVPLDPASGEALDLPSGEYLRLRVSDTGTGMAPEILELIFEPFFTTKEEGKGTGLGLSTVYGIMKQSGGHIGVESVPGQGTAFTALYPLAAADSMEGVSPRAA
jgi:PAS domain S-box-containing protein